MSEFQIANMEPWQTEPIKNAWITITNICEKGKFKVSLEINGKEVRELFYSYPSQDDGTISQSHNLSWLLDHNERVQLLLGASKDE